jgi:hypothetical protein
MMPDTGAGRWAIGFLTLFVMGLLGLAVAAATGQEGGDSLASNWWLAGPALVAAFAAVAALCASAFAILVRKERSVIVAVAAGIGLMVTVLLSGELLFPH